jgi:hypothetical protein
MIWRDANMANIESKPLMKDSDILGSLCSYDQRNPSWSELFGYLDPEDMPVRGPNCACDNCFYGRHELALEILRLKAIIS